MASQTPPTAATTYATLTADYVCIATRASNVCYLHGNVRRQPAVDMTAPPPPASASDRARGGRERRGGDAARESTAFCGSARYTVLQAFGTGLDRADCTVAPAISGRPGGGANAADRDATLLKAGRAVVVVVSSAR